MKHFRCLLTLLVALCTALSALSLPERDSLGVGSRINFTQNLGQWEAPVRYRAQMQLVTLFLENDAFTFVVQHPDNDHLRHFHDGTRPTNRYRHHAYKVHFAGSMGATLQGEEPLEGYANYFIGNDPSKWKSRVLSYQTVQYSELYRGVDMRVYSAENAMKYDFIVAPGADASQIRMLYEGADRLQLRKGDLIVKTSVMDIVELKPYAYQMVQGQEVPVEVSYVLKGNEVQFRIGTYDTTLTLVIDPYLYFSTYTGSTADSWGASGTYDSYKNTYTSGLVFDTGYPTSMGAYDGSYNGNADIGIFKFDTTGRHRMYATYLGGAMADMPHSMFVNSYDELLVLGTTGSPNFPVTVDAYQTQFQGGTPLQYEGSTSINFPSGIDMFVCRFSSDGTQLQASTYMGGSGNDGLNYYQYFNRNYSTYMAGNDSLYFNYGDGARGELIIDDQNNVYVGSTTMSMDFPTTPGCVQPYNRGGQEGVVFKLDYSLSNLLWSTYLGGGGRDAIYSIDVDNEYNLLVAGGTTSENFIVTLPTYNSRYNGGSADGFVCKISRYGNQLLASTYFGSPQYDQCYFVRTGKNNDVFLFGQTKATGNTLIHNAAYNTLGGGQFLARLTPNLDSLIWSTTFGSSRNSPDISPTAFATDICDRVYLCGWGRLFGGYTINGQVVQWHTQGTTGMTTTANAYQDSTDGQDFYIMCLSADASQLIYASFFGELHRDSNPYMGHDHVDGGTSRFDREATLYQSVCASCGGNSSFPTTSQAWSRMNNSSNCNNAIFRFRVNEDFPVAEFTIPPAGCAPYTIPFHNTGRGSNYLWNFGDGNTSTATNPTHTYNAPGTYTVTLVAYMDNGCHTTDTMTRTVMVLNNQHYWLDTLTTCDGLLTQIGLDPMPGCSYNWIHGNVSDHTVANPYVTETGHYCLVVSTTGCTDTIEQVVQLGHVDVNIVGDTACCLSPTVVTMEPDGENLTTLLWSTHSDFRDTLSWEPRINLELSSPQWLYAQAHNQLGCYGMDSIFINYRAISDSLILLPPLCHDQCNGRAALQLTSHAHAPVRYDWGYGFTDDSLNTTLCPGTHTVTIRDAEGCGLSRTFTLLNPEGPEIEATITPIVCADECTGAIHLRIRGPSAYSVLWTDNASTDTVREQLCAGRYTVEVTDAAGCTESHTYEVLDTTHFHLQATLENNTCRGLCAGKATALVQGGALPYSYQWSNGESAMEAQGLCAGAAVVTVTDDNGCTLSDTVEVGIQHSFDHITAWTDDSLGFVSESTTLHVTPIPNGGYRWSPTAGLSSPNSPNTQAVILSATNRYYITVIDSIGCEHTDSVLVCGIDVDCGETNIFIPNIFTPNGDGINDNLCFRGEWVKEFYIAIFNRWGELLYESRDINQCWDGRYKGNICQPGVYTYTCRVMCEANQESTFKGDVTIIR